MLNYYSIFLTLNFTEYIMRKFVIIIPVVLFALMVVLYSYQKVPNPGPDNIYTQSFEVEQIYSPCCKDLAFKLKGDDHINYINRGLERNIDMQKWQHDYQGKQMTFTFIRHNPLFGKDLRTIAKIEFNHQIIYDACS